MKSGFFMPSIIERMVRHHIQKSILYVLSFSDSARFSDIKPDLLDNQQFNYHLKQLINEKLVHKNSDGLYGLTSLGRKQGVSILEKDVDRVNRARSVLFLVVRRIHDGAWLLYERNTHPLIHKKGFMHATPDQAEQVIETASRELMQQTGLVAKFTYRGSGYVRVYDQGELESFTHFTLLGASDARGELGQNNIRAKFYWDTDPNFSSEDMLPHMQLLVNAYNKHDTFFIDERLSN